MIYFDNAATARYIPTEAISAYIKEINKKSNPGRGGHADSISSALSVYKVREKVCAFFGNAGGETVFTKNCTEALNLAILGTAKKGHIITTVTEHNSVLRPLSYLCKYKFVEVSYAKPEKNGVVTADKIAALIRADTYLIIINACSNVTGIRNNVEEICSLASSKGIRCLVDAAQSAGHVTFDMKNCGCDMLACAGHKGLHGVQGSGFLTFNPRVKIKPIMYGGTGTDSIKTFQPEYYPEVLESGTLNCAAICALGAGMDWTGAHLEKIQRKNKQLSAELIEGLNELPFMKVYSLPNYSGIVSFCVRGHTSEEVCDYLNENGIAVRGGLHCAPLMHKYLGTLACGLVRVGIGYCNNRYEISKILSVIRQYIKK